MTEKVQGLKYDGGKIDWSHIPWEPLGEIMKVYMMGAKKYGRGNYLRGIEYSRIFRAAIEHTRQWWQLNDLDEESGLNHLAHACWNLLTLLEYEMRGGYREFDNRAAHEPLIQDLNADLKDIEAGREPSTGTLKLCHDPNCSCQCNHSWIWQSQYSDTTGIHIRLKCSKCFAIRTDDYGLPERSTAISIPSMWLPDGSGGIVEATVTTSVPPNHDGAVYTIHLKSEEPSHDRQEAPPESTGR